MYRKLQDWEIEQIKIEDESFWFTDMLKDTYHLYEIFNISIHDDDYISFGITPKPRIPEAIFSSLKKALKEKLKDITDWKSIPSEDLESYCREYAFINFSISAARLNKINELKTNKNYKTLMNDGKGQQHWIPKCYMKQFAKDNKLKSVSNSFIFKDIFEIFERQFNIGSEVDKKPEVERIVNLESHDFKESKKLRGRFYTPETEIMFSLVESDYSAVNPFNELLDYSANKSFDKTRNFSLIKPFEEPQNCWEHVVIAYFYLLLGYRTKFIQERVPEIFKLDFVSTIIEMPSLIAYSDIEYVCVNSLNPDKENLYLPFTENPVNIRWNEKGEMFLFGIFNRRRIIIIKNKKLNLRNSIFFDGCVDYYQFYLWQTLQLLLFNGRNYFHPDDIPWSVTEYTTGITIKYGISDEEYFHDVFISPLIVKRLLGKA